jgi:NAD+ synthase
VPTAWSWATALSPDRVLALLMPERMEDVSAETEAFCRDLGVGFRTIPIGGIVDDFAAQVRLDERSLGNVKARVRMILLYAVANAENRLVAGTSNKSELLVGYFTKWGDGGTDILPIGDLYKTQVRMLASKIGIPDSIVNRVPSAELWPGQTDEDELGITYDLLDRILHGFELNLTNQEIASLLGIEVEEVERIWRMHIATKHKRRMPRVAKVGIRSVGVDWRE